METTLFWCHVTYYLRYAGKLASAWITVIISFERFLTVAYPLKVARISTPTIAKTVIGAIFVTCFILGAYPFWTIGLKHIQDHSTYCGYTDQGYYELWSMIVLRIGSLFVPSVFIFIFSVLQVTFLYRAKKERKAQLQSHRRMSKNSSNKSVHAQLTLMLIIVSISFLVLRLPYTITFYLNDRKSEIWIPLEPLISYRIYLANKICDLVAISNYAVNFFLFCLCGSSFRNRLYKFMQCYQVEQGWVTSLRTKSTRYSFYSHPPNIIRKL